MKASDLKKAKDQIRESTSQVFNETIDEKLARKLKLFSNRSPEEISREIDKLENEWDIERVLELSAAGFSILGLIAGRRSSRWLFFSGMIASFLAQQSIQRWSPPLPLLRSFGLRTRKEIEKEKYALKAIRGDFDRMGYANQNNSEVQLDAIKEAIYSNN
jgi:hypothetical protein